MSEHLCVEDLSRPRSFTGQACPRCYWFHMGLGQTHGEEKELGYMSGGREVNKVGFSKLKSWGESV